MKTKYFKLIALLFIVCSCSEKQLEPITGSLGKPGVVTEVNMKAVAGGVVVSYRIPKSEDILGVKGVYALADGKTYEASASFYENKLEILGYNDTEIHTAKLYAINRAQELSDPVEISFTPLESSLSKTIKTMDIVKDFGGAQFNWINEDRSPFTLEFLAQDSLGRMQAMKIITSESDTARQTLRGYAPEPRLFATIIRDYWGNASDTIYPKEGKLIPLFEEKLKKQDMKVMKLSNDANFTNWEGTDAFLIDDNYDTFGHSPNSSVPAALTIDLGCLAKVSRVVIYQRNGVGNATAGYYMWGNPKKIQIFGCVNKPSQSGDWNEWTKIIDGAIIKPSGSPVHTNTDEDIAVAQSGHEFVFELTQAPLRYIRVNILSTWEGTSYTHPAEVSVYGEVLEK